MFEIRKSLRALVAVGCVVLFAVAACGGQDEEAAQAAGAGAANVAEAERRLEAYREGQFESPPTTAPTPQPGKNVWIVTYGLASTPAANFDRGAREAAEVMGWKTHSCDGKFSPDQWQQCYRQAIAAGADGLAIYVNDCASTQAALREARKAGVALVSAEAADCDDQKEGAEPLFDAQLEFAQGSYRDWLAALLKPSAAYLVSKLGDDARVLLVHEAGNFAVGIMSEAFREELRELCPACEIVDTVEYTGDQLGAPLQAKLGQALLKNPDANAIVTPYDDPALKGAVQAVRESGRSDEILLTAGVGIKPALDLLREGDIDGEYVQDIAWEGWGVMDTLNRLFNGEKPKPSGQGIGWVDAENVPPAGEGYQPPIDYEAIYRKALAGRGGQG